MKARVILFKRNGKYYTEEDWEVPDNCIVPGYMDRSDDFRSIDGGPVLILSQEPWGYPHLFITDWTFSRSLMGCPSCGRGFHGECEIGCVNCHPENTQTKSITTIGSGLGAPIKNYEDVTDAKSTGRKRAALLYPINKEAACEWRGKKNCGGGPKPIIGCIEGLQRHRHHGPVKDTLRNEPGNVHRICHNCHARWHAVNDPIYNELEYNRFPHLPEEATTEELMSNEMYWRNKV